MLLFDVNVGGDEVTGVVDVSQSGTGGIHWCADVCREAGGRGPQGARGLDAVTRDVGPGAVVASEHPGGSIDGIDGGEPAGAVVMAGAQLGQIRAEMVDLLGALCGLLVAVVG